MSKTVLLTSAILGLILLLAPFSAVSGFQAIGLFVDTDGDVGMGTSSPEASLHVVETTSAVNNVFRTTNNGNSTWLAEDSSSGETFVINWSHTIDDINFATNTSSNNFRFSFNDGNLTINGDVITNNCPAGCGPADFVFEPGYDLMDLNELDSYVKKNKHLPNIPSADEMSMDGVSLTWMQMRLLEKIEELTLYTLKQHEQIKELRQGSVRVHNLDQQLGAVRSENAQLKVRLRELFNRLERLEEK